MTKNALLHLLAENRIEDLFEQLRTLQNRDLLLLQSQWNDLRQRQQLGTVSEQQVDVEDARIRQSLLDIIENAFNESSKTPGADSRPFAPARKPRWMIGIAAAAGLVIALLTILGPFRRDPAAEEGSPSVTKTLTVPTAPMSIVSSQTGPITWQLLKAERSGFNPENWQVSIQAKCIKPLYGLGVSAGTVHLRHGTDELAPYAVEFPFVQAGTTGMGSFHFQVPKSWKKATLVIYHQEYDHPKEVAVDIDLGK